MLFTLFAILVTFFDFQNLRVYSSQKNTMNRKARFTIHLLCLCLYLIHGSAWAGAGWTSYGQVVELNPTTAGRFLVKLNIASNPSGCRNEVWFYRDYTGNGVELMFHALLGAITSDKSARVYVTGRCDLNGYSEISSASIAP